MFTKREVCEMSNIGRKKFYHFYNMGLLETMKIVLADDVTLLCKGDMITITSKSQDYSVECWFGVAGKCKVGFVTL